jgi:hypothetical protein
MTPKEEKQMPERSGMKRISVTKAKRDYGHSPREAQEAKKALREQRREPYL